MRKLLTFIGLLAAAILMTACGSGDKREIELAPLSSLSDIQRDASPQVQEAYRFAFANRELIEQMPCYCGCGNMGHMHNYDCYLDNHALA